MFMWMLIVLGVSTYIWALLTRSTHVDWRNPRCKRHSNLLRSLAVLEILRTLPTPQGSVGPTALI